ncbi:type-F conjugative transfer system pilin assembly thiol-disulfide isomerase TrbB [Photobacterium damselae]|uniref:type-F conjugative transfer system pilin assembly thiol-disulfide isomerase TrbB n=1 Tax=Photobacterium damselae TaxID=38293 RepID=UPI0040692687
MKTLLCLAALLAVNTSHALSVKDALHSAIAQAETKPAPIPQKAPSTQPYGLAFIFSSRCPYCHKFAPTLVQFAKQTGLTVYPFSVDGAGLPQYPNPLTATQEIVQEFYHTTTNITYPALFLVNLNTRQHVTLSMGNVPLSALQTTYGASLNYPHLKAKLQ